MNELFKLTGEVLSLYDMLTDVDPDDKQIITDTLEAVMGELEIKAAELVPLINRLDMEMEACAKQEREWAERKKVRKNNRARLVNMIEQTMNTLGVKELAAGDVKFKLQGNGGPLPLIVDENATVPERFTRLTIETDNDLIRKALNDGEKLDFAHFGERGKHLVIK